MASAPEWVRAIVGKTDYENPMHVECYNEALPRGYVGRTYVTLMMNKYFNGVSCSHCGVELQCKCSPFKVSEPLTGKCKHGSTFDS